MLWGAAGIFVRNIEKADIGEMGIVLFRAFFSSVIIGIIMLIKDKSLFKIKIKDLWIFVSAGIFSIVLFNYSYYTTMSVTTLSVAAVLLYTAPFFVMLMSTLFFKEKITVNKTLALIIAFLGCCLVSNLFDSGNRISGKALFFGLLTGFGYALYTIFSGVALKRGYKSLTITFYVFSSAVLGTLPFINLKETLTEYKVAPDALFIVFLMAVFNTVIPYILYTTGLKGVEASVAPIIATIEPVVATFVGLILFSEKLTLSGWLGVILVLASVVILNAQSKTIKMRANAKINLGLDIKGKRDDGYHTIDTIMQSVSIYDTVSVSKSDIISVSSGNDDIDNEKNIAYKAASLFFDKTNIKGGAKIVIEKKIPMAAGLGGGSADAAAVLLALDKLYKTNLTTDKLCEMALKLGADVPFFIEGGTLRSEGIGEILTPIKPLKSGYFVLVKQSDKLSTGEMYNKLDNSDYPHPDIDEIIENIEEDNLFALSENLDNSFISVNKEFELKKLFLEMGAIGVSLSGSGPTWYGVFDNFKEANELLEKLKSMEIEAFVVKPLEKAIFFE